MGSWRDRTDRQLAAAWWAGFEDGNVHVDDNREEPVVELLVEVLHADGRVGTEDRWAEREQHLWHESGQAIGGDADRQRDGSHGNFSRAVLVSLG